MDFDGSIDLPMYFVGNMDLPMYLTGGMDLAASRIILIWSSSVIPSSTKSVYSSTLEP